MTEPRLSNQLSMQMLRVQRFSRRHKNKVVMFYLGNDAYNCSSTIESSSGTGPKVSLSSVKMVLTLEFLEEGVIRDADVQPGGRGDSPARRRSIGGEVGRCGRGPLFQEARFFRDNYLASARPVDSISAEGLYASFEASRKEA